MDGLLIEASTKAALARLVTKPPHALILEGPTGAGKATLAAGYLAQVLGVPADKLVTQPYVKIVHPVKQSISIEAIRELMQFTQLKTIGQAAIRRGILIEDAHCMTIEAQNALLKLLEEPPADTILLLTATTHGGLLSTIRSRAQTVTVLPPSLPEATAFFTPDYSTTALQRGYALSGGNVGLLTALLHDDTTHPLVTAVGEAKSLLTATVFERLARVDQLSKDRDQARLLLEALERILHVLLAQQATASSQRLEKTLRSYERVITAQQQQTRLPNLKLLLSDVFMAL